MRNHRWFGHILYMLLAFIGGYLVGISSNETTQVAKYDDDFDQSVWRVDPDQLPVVCVEPSGYIGEGTVTYYLDLDRDGYGNPEDSKVTTNCDSPPPGYVVLGTDCNDVDNGMHPGARERCYGIDDDCDGVIQKCESAHTVLTVPCDVPFSLDLGSVATVSNWIDEYHCWSPLDSTNPKREMRANEIVVVPNAPEGTEYRFQIVSQDHSALGFLLHSNFEAEMDFGHAILKSHSHDYTTLCLSLGSEISGGVVGDHVVVLDGPNNSVVTFKFTCDQ